MKLCLLAVCLCLATALAQAAPTRINATYSFAKSGQQVGVVTETFTQNGKHYELSSETKAIGIFALFARETIKLISRGEVGKNGLKPIHFEHHPGKDPDRRILADFDWNAGKLTVKYDGRSEVLPLEPDAQDRISLLYQFMYLPHGAKQFSFAMTNGKKIDRFQYVLVGEETLTTPAGQFQTLHYSRQHNPGENDTEIWLAKDKNYFPVRVIVGEKDAGKLEQTVTRLDFEF